MHLLLRAVGCRRACVCAFASLFLAAVANGLAQERPDVAWVLWDAPGLEGQGDTPVLDRLLERAVRFPATHVPVPAGRPLRTALLSGAWPRETGVCFQSGPQRGRLEHTLLEGLATAGYRTFQYGTFFRRLPKGGGFDGQGDTPESLAAFLAESAEAPRFLWFTREIASAKDGGPSDPAARRAYLDRALGQFLEALGARPGKRPLWVFVLADPTRSAPQLGPDELYERSRVRTLAVIGPTDGPRVVPDVISSLSLHTTLADLAGIELTTPLGPSLRSALETGGATRFERIRGVLYNGQGSGRGGANVAREVAALYVRDERWKYILFLQDVGVDFVRGNETAMIAHDRGTELLFDLEKDPGEAHDLATSLEFTERLRAYRDDIVAWWNVNAKGQLAVPYFSPPLGPAPEDDRPNIVLILSDDQDYEHLGFLGNPLVRTPALDRLAEEGVVFPTAHVTMSRCRPSLASLLTGRWPHQSGVYDNKAARKLVTEGSLPNLLKQAGYATFVGGKYWEGRTRAMGFMEPEKLDVRFRHFVRKSQDQLFDFVDRYAQERPFFVWWAPMLPHTPFDPPERFQKPFTGLEVPIPAGFKGDPEEYASLERTSFAMEAWLDDGLQALIDKLKSAGEYDNTLFCFLIDNGWANGHASKGTVFEKGLRTPVFFTWPAGLEGGRTNETLVSTIDVYATLLDYAKVPVPANVPSQSLRPSIEGGAPSRSTLFGVGYRYKDRRRRKDALARDVYAVYARTASTKYVYYVRDVQNPELFNFIHPCSPFPARKRGDEDYYDLVNDPFEQNDLSDDPRYAMEMGRLLAAWKVWWKDANGPKLDLP